MAEQTGIKVINDFRSEDVAQGGQGAPLVPIGDRLLFPQYQACLNLGGFANISFDNHRNERIAYDLGPANMALNWVASLAGLTYDPQGALAREGNMNTELLHRLNQLDFYATIPPKSLGREWFLERFLPLIQESGLSTADLMATVAEHIAFQISAGVNAAGIESLLVTGGGALNLYLIERLKHYTTASLVIPESKIIHYKEALIFGFLGLLKVRNEVNCLASVTGGKKDISAGTIHEI
jgi:anhydro-N-acetylmuramic acid kinase